MEKDKTLLKAHEWVNGVKASTRISYGNLGDLIGYSDAGISKALRNHSLSLSQIKLIAEKLDSINEFNAYISNLPNDVVYDNHEEYVAEKRLGVYLMQNHDRLMEDDVTYKMFIDKLTSDRAMELVRDLLSKK